MAPSVFSLLSQKFGGKKTPPSENYLALKIAKDSVAATFWEIESGKVQIGNVAVASVSQDSDKGLLNAVDEVISKVCVGVTPEPKKIIFGVSEDWISQGKLFPERLTQLRRMCRELDLSPMGFVAMNEAVENLLRESDGVPPTALLIGIDMDRIYVTLLKAGKNLGTFWEDYSSDLAQSLEKAIRKFTGVDFLPARMVIYDGRSDLEEIKQKIVAYPWTQKLSFLHFPKVEVIETTGAVKAVAAAGGTQLGGQLDLAGMDLIKEQEDTVEKFPVHEVQREIDEQNEEDAVESQKPHETMPHIDEELEPHEEETDLENENETEVESEPANLATFKQDAEFEEVDPSELGFKDEESDGDQVADKNYELEDLPVKENFDHPVKKTVGVSKITMPKINFALPKFNFKLPTPSSKQSFTNSSQEPSQNFKMKKPLVLISILLVAFCFVVGLLAYFLPSASVTVFVKPVAISKSLSLALQTGQAGSTTSAVISGKAVDAVLSQTKKGAATGKKLVGTRAKGTITIYNSNGAKNFPAGTTVASGGFKFTMDDSVSLASSSGLASQSTATVSVTANDIGDSYNLTAGSLFSIAGLPTSSYQGKNDSAFSGGSSHQATVVSKDDQLRLLATASAELESQAKGQLQAKLGVGETLLDKAITSKIDKKKFSKDVDSEADSLTLDLSVIYTGLVFDQKDAKVAFQDAVLDQIPQNYLMSLDNIDVTLSKVTQLKNGTYVLNFDFSGRALPVVDNQNVIKSAVGKGVTEFINSVKSNGIDHIEVLIKPSVFEKLGRMPFQQSKISLEVVSL